MVASISPPPETKISLSRVLTKPNHLSSLLSLIFLKHNDINYILINLCDSTNISSLRNPNYPTARNIKSSPPLQISWYLLIVSNNDCILINPCGCMNISSPRNPNYPRARNKEFSSLLQSFYYLFLNTDFDCITDWSLWVHECLFFPKPKLPYYQEWNVFTPLQPSCPCLCSPHPFSDIVVWIEACDPPPIPARGPEWRIDYSILPYSNFN